MTSSDLARVKARARGAYERAMAWAGVLRLWPLAFVMPAALVLHGTPSGRTIFVGVLLAVALFATGWRGGAWRRGAVVGVLGGLPAFFVPSLVMPAESACEKCVHAGNADASWMTCMSGCLFASLAAGLVIAHLARRDRSPRVYATSALVCAALTATITCSLAGGAGVLGVALGLALASAPVMLFAPRSAA